MLLAPQTQSHAALTLYFHPPPASRRSRGAAAAAATPHFYIPNCYSISFREPIKPCTNTTRTRSSNGPRESAFFDEDGVVQDMDAYLNHLSLEYDSVWDTKPSWCQPWTITLTGVLVIAGSWLILHSVIVTAGVLVLICAWWYIFLYSYPKAYLEMIAERRKRVTSGVEDTYGLGRFENTD